jgi:hypothetical protein
MWRDISVTDFVRNFADLINGVAYRGDRLRLKRGKRVLAEVHPAPSGHTLAELPALLRALPHLLPEDGEAFGTEIDEARAKLTAPGDAWAS